MWKAVEDPHPRSPRPCIVALVLALTAHSGAALAGGALSFHRDESDFAVIPHAASFSFADSSAATIEFWMMPVTDSGGWHVLGKRATCWDNSDLNYQCARDANGFAFGTASCGPPPIEIPPLDLWTHIALVGDGSSFCLYVNGVLASSCQACQFQGENLAALILGGSDGCGSTFDGYLDEVRIWNYARPAEEIARVMGFTADHALPGLVACWNFDEGASDQVILDSSGFGHHGTLGNDTSVEQYDPERVESTAPTMIVTDVPLPTAATWGFIKGVYRD